jgi:hypothetical protein
MERGSFRSKRREFCCEFASRFVSSIGPMKDFAHAAFAPDVIQLMTTALESAVATLPEPVHARHVHLLAESILRGAGAGERDVTALQRMALLELQLAP